MCVHSDEFWLLPFSWRSLTQSLCLWVEVFIWRGNNELGAKEGGGAAGLLGPLQLQLVRRLPFNLPRHILQKDVAGSQLKVQFQGEGAADRTCRKRERKAWLSWSVCVSLLGSHPNPATNHSRHSFAGRGIPNRTHHIAYEQYF